MPTRPPSFLQRLNATRRAVSGRRAIGSQRSQDAEQRSVDSVRGSYRWRCVSKSVLRRESLCRPCREAGRTELAVHVDHILPIAERPDLAFTLTNLQPICARCHARKGVLERGLTPRRRG